MENFPHLFKKNLPFVATHLKMRDDLLGSAAAGLNLNFYGYDNEKNYSDVLKLNDDNWYYKDRTINYKFNNLGHRCEDIDKIDFNNYALFTGDSFCMGTALEIETVFPSVISTKLKMSHYNLGLGGSGLDVMYYNLSTWLLKYPKPKFVVVYYTHYDRIVVKEAGRDHFVTANANTNVENYKKIIFYGDTSGYLLTKFILLRNSINLLSQKFEIPFYHISFIKDYNDVPNSNIKVFRFIDRGRDGVHAGIESHKVVADHIVSDYTDKYMNATVNSITRG